MPASFNLARAHRDRKAAYKYKLAEARIQALALAQKLVDMGLQEGGPINRDVIDAMKEILKDAREALGAPKKNPRKGAMGSGIPNDQLRDALDTLEGDE